MDALRGARSLPGADAPPLPLVDWRALVVVPAMPDETFMPVGGYAGDADTFAATAAASAVGTYPVLTGDGVMVQPSADPWRRGMLRAVQSPLTDPVSFALARGETTALYPRVGGWSVHDVARRAVAEHRGFLAGPGRHPIGAFRAFAMLFTAARAALLHESLAAERPELLLTVSAVAGRLADRAGPRRAAVEAAHEAYRAGRLLEDAPARDLVAPLSEVVRDLPAYTPAAASGRVAAVA